MLSELETQLQDVMLRDQFRFRRQFEQLKRAERQQRLNEDELLKLAIRIERSSALRGKRASLHRIPEYNTSLPILDHREEIISAIQKHPVLIVAGETGSGKTTQLPKMCLEAGYGIAGKIGCTQPRRVAAISIAQQIARELQCNLGEEVGYKIRFSDKTSPNTLIQLLTDGTLLAETQSDRFLENYEVLIIDEAHERSLNIDFLLGYIRRLQPKRSNLKLIITSASIDTGRFAEAFSGAPIIEVSGRSYPVEIDYRPIDPEVENQGDYTVEDAMVDTIRELLETTYDGDVLAFLAGEGEIREVCQRVGQDNSRVLILPLYGRLTQAEQHRIFQNSSQRKVIISTNLAETSLTIPGIRYVIDSGLARISRYSPKNRVQRLPVEPIAQSSALQRAGRAGRVAPGVCIRLYSEESLQNRREYVEPEILRSNLAGVILQMLYLRLGNIREFPFIDPPGSHAIREGEKLLRELGAVTDNMQLTPLGREMATLPIEPQTARMLLQAHQESVLSEMLVIAAGLSIQDPREFPAEEKEKARQMHSSFVSRESDYITLLSIWRAYQAQWNELKTENKMRKFCRQHFLSFVRMREWRDIHHQLSSILKDSGKYPLKSLQALPVVEAQLEESDDREVPKFRLNRPTKEETKPKSIFEVGIDYDAIHRALLSGYLNCIARQKDKQQYSSIGGKELWVFPGSGVYKRSGKWILAGEQVETSRLYSRKIANIKVDWLEQIGGKLCKRHYSEAHFDPETGIVQAWERVTLYGLTIVEKRRVSYGRVNPAEATAIFVREALIDGGLRQYYPFFKHNNELRELVLSKGAKLRRDFREEVDAMLEAFYQEKIQNVASFHDLNRLLKTKRKSGQGDFLFLEESEITPSTLKPPSSELYPDFWEVGDLKMPLRYVFAPTKEPDGVTLQLQDASIPHLHEYALEWLIPGIWAEKIQFFLRALPKSIRKSFVPLPETSAKLASELKPCDESFLVSLCRLIERRYQIKLKPSQWADVELPSHLQMRVEVRNANQKIVSTGRNLEELISKRKNELRERGNNKEFREDLRSWKDALKFWELDNLQNWTFERLPQRIELEVNHGIPLYAYPGLLIQEDGSILRTLFHTRDEAQRKTQPAMKKLMALAVGPELVWLEQELWKLEELRDEYRPFGTLGQLKQGSKQALLDYLFEFEWLESEEEFLEKLKLAKHRLPKLLSRYIEQLRLLLQAEQKTRAAIRQYTKNTNDLYCLQEHLQNLVPTNFVAKLPYLRWAHVQRYLKGIRVRAERLDHNPVKDEEKSLQLQPWLEVYQELKLMELNWNQRKNLDEFFWLLEEYRVSLFAPELKTSMPISVKRLTRFLEEHFPEASLVVA
ncbi:MAG: ATP-dependent RNA helicase HrpA [bacterium]